MRITPGPAALADDHAALLNAHGKPISRASSEQTEYPKAKARPPERLAIRARLADNDAEQSLESSPRQAARLVATRSLQEGKSP